jgi:predicted cupin superfamily sugar epimerase
MLPLAQVLEMLELEPHPTCGFMSETFRSSIDIPASVVPATYGGSRSLGGVLYFLIAPRAPVRLHRIRSDQMYHHYLGNPLEVLLLDADGKHREWVVGPDLAAGMRPQLLIPGGVFHAARVQGGSGYALLGTSVWLRAEAEDVEIGDPGRLSERYPEARAAIRAYTSVPA